MKKFINVSRLARRLNGLPEFVTCHLHQWVKFLARDGCPRCSYMAALEAEEEKRVERLEREGRWHEVTGEEW